MVTRLILALTVLTFVEAPLLSQRPEPETTFRVRYVAADAIYLDGGREDELAEGTELDIRRRKPGAALIEEETVGRVRVTAVAAHSAACEIVSGADLIEVGDVATLTEAASDLIRYLMNSKSAREYAQVVTFTDMLDGDPLEVEQRAYVPRPPLSEINRVRGRIAFEHNSLIDREAGLISHYSGAAIRIDMTRIGGTYWNFRGYWRGRMLARHSGLRNQTIRDLVNRTYTIGFTYDNPYSRWVMGFGRLLLPWATSLSTLDGGYLGRRAGRYTTIGMFGGTTPDPTAWDYDPGRQIVGAFTSFDAGSFETVRYVGTFGVAHTRRNWIAERQFAFLENGIFAGRNLNIYHSAEVDYQSAGRFGSAQGGPVLSRSFLTVRARANEYLTLNLSHSYFRTIPTFDTRLIGIGNVDALLFQGLTGGFRLELPRGTAVYASLGRSRRKSDRGRSWNYLAGVTIGSLPVLDLRADIRTSRFDSSFGSGRYVSLGLSREMADGLRLQLQGGRQVFESPLTKQRHTNWLDFNVDWLAGEHYVLGGGYALYRGKVQNYDQAYFRVGYRF